MNCKNCGKELYGTMQFCPDCGADVDSTGIGGKRRFGGKIFTPVRILIIVLLVILAVVLFVLFYQKPYEKVIERYLDSIAEQDVAMYREALFPKEYHEGMKKKLLCKDDKAYEEILQNALRVTLQMEEEKYGSGIQYTVEGYKDVKKFSDSERKEYQESLSKIADMDIEKGYNLKADVKVEGSNGGAEIEKTFAVIKVGKEWYVVQVL
ncbi:MAG: zinc ribbon domain-containing protein [Eubacteriales bacterium]|nr:zinc ribbon domain-containing protein [Eubacteriales bacterium]